MRALTPTEPGTSRGRILVVDDVEANREILQQELEDEGFEVACAGDGAGCLAAVWARAPEVILLDIQMAGIDGIELCRRLKADPVTSHIPVIFVTANRADDVSTVAALRAGGNDFLTKPYSPPVLVARVMSQITIARAHASLRRQAMVDELTSVYSRRYLFDVLRRTIKATTRTGGAVGCLMADVDHFKAINDTRGHLEGDRVLQDIARAISDSVRSTDVVARYGGEEFVILLPGTNLDASCLVAEKIRASIEVHCAPVTISIGASALTAAAMTTRHDDATIEQLVTGLLRDADRGVYMAKCDGRNRVRCAGNLHSP